MSVPDVALETCPVCMLQLIGMPRACPKHGEPDPFKMLNVPDPFILYEVGGCVRDSLLGIPSKDIDFSVVVREGWRPILTDPSIALGCLESWLSLKGFEVFLVTPQYFTIRARFPRSDKSFAGQTADFVLCRREGFYGDGRRPDEVFMGTLIDDLSRRDFTVNAMARDGNGNIIDPFGGREDVMLKRLRCVGDPFERFGEDALRMLRALRFSVTRGFSLDAAISFALTSPSLINRLEAISVDRKRDELTKAFKHDTPATLQLLNRYPRLYRATFMDGLWLKPTTEQ